MSKSENIFSAYPLTVHHHPMRGNHVHATGPCEPGTDVYVCPPFGSVVHPSRARDVCSVCYVERANIVPVPGPDGRGTTGLTGLPVPHAADCGCGDGDGGGGSGGGGGAPVFKRCADCQLVSYCSAQCEALGAEAHARCCSAFLAIARAARRVTGSLSMLLLCAAIIETVELPGEETEENRALTGVPQTNLEAFLRLQANKDKLEPEEIEEYEADAKVLQECSKRASKYPPSLIVDFFGRVACNCFRIENADLDLLGLALYPGASFFNHTCDPNTVYVFNGKSMVFRALRPITAGEEVTISYIRLVGGKARRRAKLLSHYYFECTCALCHREPDFPGWEGMFCPSCKTGELVAPKPPKAAGNGGGDGDGDGDGARDDVSAQLGSMSMVICPDPVALEPTPEPAALLCGQCGASEPLSEVRARVRRVLRKLRRLKSALGEEYDEEEENLGDAELVALEENAERDGDQKDIDDDYDDDDDEDDDDDDDDDDDTADDAEKAERWRRRRERQRVAIAGALQALKDNQMAAKHHLAYQIHDHVRTFYESSTDRQGGGAFPSDELVHSSRAIVEYLEATIPEHECETALECEKLAEALLDRCETVPVVKELKEAIALTKIAVTSTALTYGDAHLSVKRLLGLQHRAEQALAAAS